MSLPFRERGPFRGRGRGPFRGRGPWAGKGPFGFNDQSSFWSKRLFFSEREFAAAPGSSKTLATQAVLQALGWSNAQSTSNPPATVIGRDGNLQYAAHNLLAYSAGPRSTWSKNESASDGGSGNPIDGFPTSRFVGISTGGYYKWSNTIIPSGQPFVIAHYVAHVSGNAVFCGGTESGKLYFNTSTGAFTGGPEVKGARAVPGGWLIWGLYTGTGSVVAALNYTQGTDGTFDVASWVTYGVRPLDYVPTASAAAYGIPITHDRGATHCLTRWTSDLTQLFPDTVTTAGQFTSPDGLATLQLATSSASPFNLGVGFTALSNTCTLVAYIKRGSFDYDANSKYGFYNSSTGDIGYATPNYSTGKIEAIQSLAGTITARTEPMGNGVFRLIVTATGGMSPGDWCLVYAGATGGIVGAGRQHWTSGCHVNDGPLPLPFLGTFGTSPLFSAGTPTRQNLASGGGTQSIAVAKGCVYTVLHQSGGTYTLSGAGSGTTSVGTAATVVATTDSLTLTASGSPTLLQVYEGTAALPYIAGPISEYPQAGILVAEGRTRETLQPRDLTQASWTKTNVTAAKTALGVTGAADSATTLTATAANGTVLQAITSASANRAFSAHVRSRSASNLIIDMTCDGGTTWQAVEVNAAYLRLAVTQATVTNPSYGFRLRASGDSIDVDFVQGEIGAFASPPIWGIESAAQARDVTQVTLPASTINDIAQTTAIGNVPSTTADGLLLGRAGFGLVAYWNSASARIYDGTRGIAVGNGVPSYVFHRIVSRYSAAGMSVLLDGSTGSTVWTEPFDGAMGNAGAPVGLGHDPSGAWGPFTGLITSLAWAPKFATDTQLQLASRGALP